MSSFAEARVGQLSLTAFWELLSVEAKEQCIASIRLLRLRGVPCFICTEPPHKHVGNACLFGSTKYTAPDRDNLRYYVFFGYFHGRHA